MQRRHKCGGSYTCVSVFSPRRRICSQCSAPLSLFFLWCVVVVVEEEEEVVWRWWLWWSGDNSVWGGVTKPTVFWRDGALRARTRCFLSAWVAIWLGGGWEGLC